MSHNDEFLRYLKFRRLGTYISTSQIAWISKPWTSFWNTLGLSSWDSFMRQLQWNQTYN